MDLSLTDEQSSFREIAREFLDKEAVPHRTEWDRRESVDLDIVPGCSVRLRSMPVTLRPGCSVRPRVVRPAQTPPVRVTPPSSTTVCPVVHDDSSLSRKATVAATSSGVPSRFSGYAAATSSSRPS